MSAILPSWEDASIFHAVLASLRESPTGAGKVTMAGLFLWIPCHTNTFATDSASPVGSRLHCLLVSYFHAFKFLIKYLIPSRWRFACRAYQEPWKVQNVCGMGCPSFFSVDCGDFWQDAWFSAKDLRSPWFISSSTPSYSLWCATDLLQLELRTFGVSKIVALRTNVAAILCFNPPMCGCERTGDNPACVGRAARPKACLLSQRCAEWAMVLVAPVCGISTAQLPADCTARRWSQVSGDSK